MNCLSLRAAALALCSCNLAVGQQPPGIDSPPAVADTAPAFTPIAKVETRGTGPVHLVLIPGLGCDWTVFESFMDRNRERYTMHAVTLPGFGGTDAPLMPPADVYGEWIANAARAIWAVVEKRGISKPVIVGHSLGGHLALRVGAEHGSAVAGVVTIDGPPAFQFGPTTMDAASRQAMAAQMTDMYRSLPPAEYNNAMRLFFARMVGDEQRGAELGEMCSTVPRDVTLRYMADLFAADLRPSLPKLIAPTLAIVAVPVADMTADMAKQVRENWKAMMSAAPQATVVFFEDTRHFVQDDRPTELDAAVADFLAGRPVKGVQATGATPATVPAVPPRP